MKLAVDNQKRLKFEHSTAEIRAKALLRDAACMHGLVINACGGMHKSITTMHEAPVLCNYKFAIPFHKGR